LGNSLFSRPEGFELFVKGYLMIFAVKCHQKQPSDRVRVLFLFLALAAVSAI
jgi:hypothetical protein